MNYTPKIPDGWENISKEELADNLRYCGNWSKMHVGGATWFIAFNRKVALETEEEEFYITPHPMHEPTL